MKTSDPKTVYINPVGPEAESYFAAKNKARQARKEFLKEILSYLGFIAIIAAGVAALLGLGFGMEAIGKKWDQVTVNAAAIKELKRRADAEDAFDKDLVDRYNVGWEKVWASHSALSNNFAALHESDERVISELISRISKLENPQPPTIWFTNYSWPVITSSQSK